MRSRSQSLNFVYLDKLDVYGEEQIQAIDCLIEDIHNEKDLTSKYLINHRHAENFINVFISLLNHSNYLLVGNAAFILGTLFEFNVGLQKILKEFDGSVNTNGDNYRFTHLVNLLNSNHSDVVMNTAGALGTLVETQEGRNYLMRNLASFNQFIMMIPKLLISKNLWTCSNAALIIARLTIDEDTIEQLLESPHLEKILKNLVCCLGIDSAGKGMNSAFALGRILDNERVWNEYWPCINKFSLIQNLAYMSNSPDLGSVKNSCFCLSTVISKRAGFHTILKNKQISELIVRNFTDNLDLSDEETVWFILMTLKTICKYNSGILLLRRYSIVRNIEKCRGKTAFSSEIAEQCDDIILYLVPLGKPDPPFVQVKSATEVHVSWNIPATTRKDFKTSLYYKEKNEEVLVFRGTKTEVCVTNLKPNTTYEFFMRFFDEIDSSPSSQYTCISTAEDMSSPPCNLRAVVKTPTQLKVEWDQPINPNGAIKSYQIYINRAKSSSIFKQAITRYFPANTKKEKYTDQTTDTSYIISGLQPDTKYTISVCALNNAGKGKCEIIDAFTSTAGAHAPNKVSIVVLGRLEMSLYWYPPEEVLGRLFRYEVVMNNKVIYSGTNTFCKVDKLKPNTEYRFCIVAVTSEGRFESTIHKKKTKADGYASLIRPPLFPGNRFKKLSKDRNNKNEFDVAESDQLSTHGSKSTNKKRDSSVTDSTRSTDPFSSEYSSTYSDFTQASDCFTIVNSMQVSKDNHQQRTTSPFARNSKFKHNKETNR